jgi:hypothetical protein
LLSQKRDLKLPLSHEPNSRRAGRYGAASPVQGFLRQQNAAKKKSKSKNNETFSKKKAACAVLTFKLFNK